MWLLECHQSFKRCVVLVSRVGNKIYSVVIVSLNWVAKEVCQEKQ